MQRAYSTFTIKSADESTGIIEGIASTPSTDRMGDVVDPEGAHFTLRIALDQLRTGNFLMQAAARTLVSRHGAVVLAYDGSGPAEGSGWRVSGVASAGDVELDLELLITAIGTGGDAMAEIELVGSANVGTVHLPLPGMGTIEDFSFDVDARLSIRPRHA